MNKPINKFSTIKMNNSYFGHSKDNKYTNQIGTIIDIQHFITGIDVYNGETVYYQYIIKFDNMFDKRSYRWFEFDIIKEYPDEVVNLLEI